LNSIFIYLIFRQRPDCWKVYSEIFKNPGFAGGYGPLEDTNVEHVLSGHSPTGTIEPRLLSLSSNSQREVPTSSELDWNNESNPDSGSVLQDERVGLAHEFPFSSVRDFYLDGVYDHLPSPHDFSMMVRQTAIPDTPNLNTNAATLIPTRESDPALESIFDTNRSRQAWVPQTGLPDSAGESSNVDHELSLRPQITPRIQGEISLDNTQQFNVSNAPFTWSTPTITYTCPDCGKEFFEKSSER
jgi:hypothetical protein